MEVNATVHVQPISEERLRAWAKDVTSIVSRCANQNGDVADTNKLISLLTDLISTFESGDISAAHRCAACNLLSALINECSTSSSLVLQSLLWHDAFWESTFDSFLKQASHTKPKPIRQLLNALISALSQHDGGSQVVPIKARTLSRIVSALVQKSHAIPIKPAVLALGQLLAKRVVSFQELASCYAKAQCLSDAVAEDPDRMLIELSDCVLQLAISDELAPSVSPLILVLNSTYHDSPGLTPQVGSVAIASRLAESIISYYIRQPDSIDNLDRYILPSLLSQDFVFFKDFLEPLQSHRVFVQDKHVRPSVELGESHIHIILCTLSIGAQRGWVVLDDDKDSISTSTDNPTIFVPIAAVERWLACNSRKTRVGAWKLLQSTRTPTKRLPPKFFSLLRQCLPSYHADTDANFRSDLFGLMQRLIDRLRASSAVHAKYSNTAKVHTYAPRERRFLSWYASLLAADLRPTASYQRHICSLKCLGVLLRSGIDAKVSRSHWSKSALGDHSWPFTLDIVNRHHLQELLLDLTLDPFDDVRSLAASTLRIMPWSADTTQSIVLPALLKAETLAKRSSRADHADGVAHLHTIMFTQARNVYDVTDTGWGHRIRLVQKLVAQLDRTLLLISLNITAAIAGYPLHGIMLSIRYIFEQPLIFNDINDDPPLRLEWREVVDRIFQALHKAWDVLRPTLCSDAPEGYMPEDIDETDGDLDTKDVMSYSWRALKEASLLQGVIVTRCPERSKSDALLSFDQLQALGELSFVQLVDLRHRGAFSTVAQTFITTCARCAGFPIELPDAIPFWYERSLKIIRESSTINTRRSAGLPSLMIGVLTADQSQNALFIRAMRDLMQEAAKPVHDRSTESLSQVHALNCIKDIFKSSKLSEKSGPYIPTFLEFAGQCLSSESWAVRNSGLMLFRALLDRMLGTNEAYANDESPPQTTTSMSKMPDLTSIILRLLSRQSEPGFEAVEGVFPALQLLQRAPQSLGRQKEIVNAVFGLMGSRHWHVRDKAAQTYAMLVATDVHDSVICLLNTSSNDQNALHGALLCCRYLLRRATLDAETEPAILWALQEAIPRLYHTNPCPVTQFAFVELLTVLPLQPFLGNLVDISHNIGTLMDSQSQVSASALLRRQLVKIAVNTLHTGLSDTTDLIMLMTLDADACEQGLLEAAQAFENSHWPVPSRGRMLLELCSQLLGPRSAGQAFVPARVQDAARQLLLVLFQCHSEAVTDDSISCFELVQNAQTPLARNNALIVSSHLIAAKIVKRDVERSTIDAVSQWIVMARSAAQEDMPFDTRLAAAQGVRRIGREWLILADCGLPLINLLDIALLAYDLLNDDEDEIRDLASETASRIVATAWQPAIEQMQIPLISSSKLAGYLIRRFRSLEHLAQAAISRMTSGNLRVAKTTISAPVSELIDETGDIDSALFAEEKQNLFIDPAREARLWSQVLLRLSTRALPDETLHGLTDWTLYGIDALLVRADQEVDGALGWTRKTGVYEVGLQVIYAAEVLLDLRKRTKRVEIRGSVLRARLAQLLISFKRSGVNALWVDQLEKVLIRSITEGMRGSGKILMAVEHRLA